MKFIAGAVLLCLATGAAAQSATIRGGGATLPQIAYTGDNTANLNSPVSGSVLGSYSAISGNPQTTYCPTGSGTGKKILAGNDSAFNVNGTCLGSPSGFGGSGLTQPHFVGSDSPLATSDMTAYAAGHTATGAAPVQFPSLSGAIAVSFHKAGVTTLSLNETQVCKVFSGQIKTWQDLRASSTTTGIPSTVTGNITVVYRADGSGTSFNFSNHLSAMCGPTSIGGLGVASGFKTDQAFSNAIATFLSAGAYAATDGTASGNTGVVTKVGAVDGAIGYAEVANVVAGTSAKYAKVSNQAAPGTFIDPASYGGTILPVAVTYDKGISGVDTNGRPVLSALSTTAKCIAVVDPSNYAKPTSGYPIVAVTYLLGNALGNGADATAVRNVLGAPYNSTVRSNTFSVGSGTGYSWLSNADMTQAKINACVVN